MKILVVTQYYWPERFKINDICQGLLERGHEVTVLTGLPNYPQGKFFPGYGVLKGPWRQKHDGVEILRVPMFSRGPKKGWRLMLNFISFFLMASIFAPFVCKGKYDRIFVYEPSPVTVVIPAIVLKWIKKIPVYFWVTDLWPETLIATGALKSQWAVNMWGKIVKFLYEQCDVVMVTSKGFIDKIAARGISRDKIVYWPQWGESLFSKTKLEEDKMPRSEIPDGFKIMFAGNIGTSQSFDTILDAAESLKDYEQIKWVILGDGMQRKWVEDEVRIRGLKENFYLLGPKPMETMPYYYSLSDVLLASLKKDPLFAITVPAKIQSYLPSGKPVLVSMDGEGADLIEDAGAGVACRASDSKELANGVLKLYQMTQEERVEMGQRGVHYFNENFDREKLLSRLEKIMSLSV